MNKYQFGDPELFNSKTDAESWWSKMQGGKNYFDLKDVTGSTIRFDDNLKNKLLRKKPRFSIVKNILNIIAEPDEVWLTKDPKRPGALRKSIIKYYKEKPMVIEVNADMRAFSMYELDRGAMTIEQYKQGALLYVKK